MYSSIQSVLTKVKDSIGSYLFSSSQKKRNAANREYLYQTSPPRYNALQPELALSEDIVAEPSKSICNTPSFYLNKKEQHLYPNDYLDRNDRKLNLNDFNEPPRSDPPSNYSSSENETNSIIANANKFTSSINNPCSVKLLGNKNAARDKDETVPVKAHADNKRKTLDSEQPTKDKESESESANAFTKLFEQRKRILEEFKKQQNDKKNIIVNYYTPSHNPRFNHLSLEYSKQIYIPSKQKEEVKRNNDTAVREKEPPKKEDNNDSKIKFCAPQNQTQYKSIFTTETSQSKVSFGFSSEKKPQEQQKETTSHESNKPLFGFNSSEQKEYKSIFDNKPNVTFGFKEDKVTNTSNNAKEPNKKGDNAIPPKETKPTSLFEPPKATTSKSLFDSPIKNNSELKSASAKTSSILTNAPEAPQQQLAFDSSTTTTSLFSNTTQTKSLFEQSPKTKSLFATGKSLFDSRETAATSFSKPSLFSSNTAKDTTPTPSQPLNLFSSSSSSLFQPTSTLFGNSSSLFSSSTQPTAEPERHQPQQGLFSSLPKSTLFTSTAPSDNSKKFEFSFGKK